MDDKYTVVGDGGMLVYHTSVFGSLEEAENYIAKKSNSLAWHIMKTVKVRYPSSPWPAEWYRMTNGGMRRR